MVERSLLCWVCGEYFSCKRCTAMCCSAACRKVRSRFAAKNGRFPRLGELTPYYLKRPRNQAAR